MTVFQTIAALFTAAAFVGYVNQRWVRLPSTIAQMSFALVISATGVVLGRLGFIDFTEATAFVSTIDFSSVFMNGMLSLLLFAGAFHVDINDLRKVQFQVISMATFGILISTFITGSLLWAAAEIVGVDLPYLYALLFGSLISPTDPIAVLALLRKAQISKRIYAKIGGESLLNDGVSIVTFVAILNFIHGHAPFSPSVVFGDVSWKVLGGVGLGLLLGFTADYLLKTVNDYKVEILLTLSFASGGYVLADLIETSAPITIAIAGLVIGNKRDRGNPAVTQKHLSLFWELLDEILNAILFILMGIEMIIIPFKTPYFVLSLCAVPVLLIARYISVGIPIWITRIFRFVDKGTVRLLTWGGMRGGISIAMALSLPVGPYKDLILSMTYMVVVFSILVQGLTFPALVRMIAGKEE